MNVRDVIIVMSELNKISPLLLTLARAQISIRDCVLYGVGWLWLVVVAGGNNPNKRDIER